MPAKKKCFVISPIGKPGEEPRRYANWFLNGIVKPALEDLFEVRRGDDDRESEIITTKVIERIREADLIVADLTGSNPNVFYELGVAHSFERRVIQMIRGNPADVPFDVNPVRTVPYSVHEFDDLGRYQKELREAAQAMMRAEKVRNPVTAAQGVANLSTGADSQKELIETLAREVAELRSIVTRPSGGYLEFVDDSGRPRSTDNLLRRQRETIRRAVTEMCDQQIASVESGERFDFVEDILQKALSQIGPSPTVGDLRRLADDTLPRYKLQTKPLK
jgi:hypothetical protein